MKDAGSDTAVAKKKATPSGKEAGLKATKELM